MLILALETSCDETAVAVLRGSNLLASEVASQITIHQAYGGVVPEVASRNHLRMLRPTLLAALNRAAVSLSEIDAVAATVGPGLATSLMVGSSAAKALALGLGKPFLGINHMEGHLLSPFFRRLEGVQPAVGLIVSGGHTLLLEIRGFGDYCRLGQTRDDAAGEAFDKVGKLLGLPYPGGPNVDRMAQQGDPRALPFPRGMLNSGDLDFSFSGLKTAVRTMLPKISAANLPDVCASFQEAIVEVLVEKTIAAAHLTGRRTLAISGGVSRNSRLRAAFKEAAAQRGFNLLLAEPALCTDNAGMIAHVAALAAQRGRFTPITAEIDPNLRVA